MSGLSVQPLLNQMKALASQAAGGTQAINEDTPSFGDAFKASLNRISGMEQKAESQNAAFQVGAPGSSLQGTMIATSEASLALNMGVQVRNKLVDAYNTIMNMQV